MQNREHNLSVEKNGKRINLAYLSFLQKILTLQVYLYLCFWLSANSNILKVRMAESKQRDQIVLYSKVTCPLSMNQKSFQFLVQGGEKDIYEGVGKIPWYFFLPILSLGHRGRHRHGKCVAKYVTKTQCPSKMTKKGKF